MPVDWWRRVTITLYEVKKIAELQGMYVLSRFHHKLENKGIIYRLSWKFDFKLHFPLKTYENPIDAMLTVFWGNTAGNKLKTCNKVRKPKGFKAQIRKKPHIFKVCCLGKNTEIFTKSNTEMLPKMPWLLKNLWDSINLAYMCVTPKEVGVRCRGIK